MSCYKCRNFTTDTSCGRIPLRGRERKRRKGWNAGAILTDCHSPLDKWGVPRMMWCIDGLFARSDQRQVARTQVFSIHICFTCPTRVDSWLPDGYSQIFRLYLLGLSGFWTMAPLRCAAKWCNPRKGRDQILPSGNLECIVEIRLEGCLKAFR